GCAGQYNIGAALGTFTLAATNSAGVNLQTTLGSKYPAPGSWFVIKVTSGTWQNNGIGEARRTLAYKMGASPTWYPLSANPNVGCADTQNATYYLQMSIGNGAAFLRVYDTDGNFISNTGALTITIYGVAAYTHYESGCELQYEVGEFIEQKMVNADRSGGWPLNSPVQIHTGGAFGGELIEMPKRYYMLETIGGPASLGAGGYTWDADLGLRDSDTDISADPWYAIGTAPFVECVVSTDLVGHVKVFFALDEATDLYTYLTYYYSFRVRDTGSYTDNSGSLSYRLYQATNEQKSTPGDPPQPGTCISFSHNPTAMGSIVIQGNNNYGTSLPTLTHRAMYALEVVDGPWKDHSVDNYALQISDDDGVTWVALEDYPNLLCASSSDGDHVVIWVYHAAGKIWRVRADDGDSNFANNSQSIGLKVYSALSGIVVGTCQDVYSLTQEPMGEEQRTVPGNMESGKTVPWIVEGHIYSIEITDEAAWYENGEGTGRYLVDISDDGGTTWGPLEGYANLCTEQLGNSGGRYQIYFTAQSSNYKLRVRDGDNYFLSNTGYVLFNLYAGTDTTNPLPLGTPGTPPPEWVVACNEAYARPARYWEYQKLTSFTILGETLTISVPLPLIGEWLDYLRAAVTFYFAWCPQHTEALKNIGQVVLMDREPMASIADMVAFFKGIQTSLEAYQAMGGETGGNTSQEPDLFSDTGLIGEAGGGESYNPSNAIGAWD
ncbi:MAG: hypothetical protein IMZ50_05815, partial [Candidatus Atribacteria bacterium]|nr:hypothetical protein [Candidatus Atribacteria bacterium]